MNSYRATALCGLLALSIAGSPLDASAQGGDQMRPAREQKDTGRPARPSGNPCAQFGPGFVRAANADTCVRVGGSIGVGVGGSVMPGR